MFLESNNKDRYLCLVMIVLMSQRVLFANCNFIKNISIRDSQQNIKYTYILNERVKLFTQFFIMTKAYYDTEMRSLVYADTYPREAGEDFGPAFTFYRI